MRYATLGLCLVLVLAGCSGATGGDSTPTVTTSDGASETATPTATATATATETAVTTSSPTATATATPTATETLSPTPTATPTETTPSLNSSEFTAVYTDALERRNVRVAGLENRDGMAHLAFETTASNASEFTAEVNTAAVTYAQVVQGYDGYEPLSLRILTIQSNNVKIAHYDVETEWVRELADGDRTRAEFFEAIGETAHRYRPS